MKAFILKSSRHLEPVDLAVPQAGPMQVRVKIAYTGICGSDVEAYLGHRKLEFLTDPPMLGHEPSGVIDQVGEQVSGLRAGDRVTTVGVWGAFSEYLVCRPENVMRLLPEVSLLEGSLIEVLPGIVNAATKTGITRSSSVLILGQGLSGLQLTRLVAFQGCRNLIAADLFEEKLALSREFGATHCIHAATQDILAEVERIVPGGVDVTIMATLNGNDVPRAVDWTRAGGKIVLYGSIGPCDGIDFFRVHRKGISIVKEGMEVSGGFEHRRMWREAMQLVADGILPTHRLRTHILPLEQLPEGMELRATPRGDVLHVLMENDWAREIRLRGEFF